ncbi:MAG: hypothetical protein A2V52_01270 [Actinobacteria bacterium RBG_19FT_COMBO_54_7]|uniref:Radical SAM core domain-containing protein n=1 Tax=Candidatus Solincola sediminis TaxID=1797199 RepID=A0A1F2WQF4_9ACTN|nr:MAG: hypothetical protein A2Y75_05100 [Candidatus Solincola sediminis]OFW70587.1 MAG: hypothetical protein A2V52_01270 [Actinobacteria bacterium RBG_19FT_COMBO_54_7]
MSCSDSYLRLADHMHLKVLEGPYVYDIKSDELYELSREALDFLSRCDGSKTTAELRPEMDFLELCLDEGVLRQLQKPQMREIACALNESPSLRYLMLEVTDRCNLRCRHCYLGEAGHRDLEWETVQRILDDCDEIGLLRLIITGGEPFLYPHFEQLNSSLAGRSFRSIITSNGTAMDGQQLEILNVQEIQFSIDGLAPGHNLLRGEGNFEKTMTSVGRALQAGFDVSVATIIHSGNYDQLEALGELLSKIGVSSWTLEFPVPSGRMADHIDLMPDPVIAAPYFELEWGWGAHESLEGYACGAHLACIDTSGRFVKCGYYRRITGGNSARGLRQNWIALPKMRLEGVCSDCELLAECGGGCRYRAESLCGPGAGDPVMCARLGKRPSFKEKSPSA